MSYVMKSEEVVDSCSLNPFNAVAISILSTRTQIFRRPSKPCYVGIHWIALTDHSQMSTHIPGFQSFFRYFVSAKLATSSRRVNPFTLRVSLESIVSYF